MLIDLEEEKDDRHDKSQPGWMKALMGKVPSDNIYVRPTRTTRELYYEEEARIENKLETGLHSDTINERGVRNL